MESLGVNPVLLLTQAINFLIMLGVLSYFVYKPILKTLEERRKKIEKGLRLQEEMETEKQRIEEIKRKIIFEANEEGREIIRRAVEEAKKKSSALLAEGKKEIREEREMMRQEIAREKEKIIEEAKKQSFHYAFLISEKIIGKRLGKREHEEIVEEALSRLQKF